MNNTLKFVISIVTPFVAGAIGNIATIPNIPTWYETLEKPFFNPPNEVFGPVWSILYLLMGISLYIVWSHKKQTSRNGYVAFGVQLALNTLWSIVFFGLHQPWWSLLVILALIFAIIVTMREFWNTSKLAAWLLAPYIAWVSFATCLNFAIAYLN